MNRLYKALNIAAAWAALFAGVAAADSWMAPTEQDYYSSSRAYYLHVVPGDGSRYASASLYEVIVDAEAGGDALLKWSRDLANPYAPHKVLVADSGRYVVTFDEWGGVGYGSSVVVVYGPGGELIKQFALEDLLAEEELEAVPHTVSSRWWGGEHYLDEEAGVVVLAIGGAAEPAAFTAPGRELRIRLADGEVLP
jgi:hypothetical protein